MAICQDADLPVRFPRMAAALGAEELGMRPLQAHCHLGLGTLYLKTDRPEQVRAELTTAIDLYRAMDMTFWLPQAEGRWRRWSDQEGQRQDQTNMHHLGAVEKPRGKVVTGSLRTMGRSSQHGPHKCEEFLQSCLGDSAEIAF